MRCAHGRRVVVYSVAVSLTSLQAACKPTLDRPCFYWLGVFSTLLDLAMFCFPTCIFVNSIEWDVNVM